ncbi:CRISPR-associated helicase Cas3' [Dokdonella koreensis]|uniref:CRISPR-associated helicase Cas3' n=1 Tax=Dokdonella koreensis TaxID=323415 RepID=UPI001CBF386F|nr:CRISPR-associated helicase Cas3' [Dokdonella koreensis]
MTPDNASCVLAQSSPSVAAAHYRAQDDCWQPLLKHLLGTADWAKRFAEKLGLGMLGELLGLLHDLGKYSQVFQAYLKSAVGKLVPDVDEDWVDAVQLKGKIDHSSAGAQYVWQVLGQGHGRLGALVGQLSALCIASHHSGLINTLSPTGKDDFIARMRKDDGKTHLSEALESADRDILERCEALLADPALLEQVDAVIKRIEQRNPGQADAPRFQQFGLLVRFMFSCLVAGDRIDTADFENPDDADLRPAGQYEHWTVLIQRLESHLAGLPVRYPIDTLRQSISLDCLHAASNEKGIFTLTVPTGGGKTLASLRFALHHAQERKLDRIVYVVPFTAIIDQNARVARAVLEPDATVDDGLVVLEHHGNLAPERDQGREKLLAADWDAPVVYTTMVQFLEALFGAGTRGARRMHQLANAVLVFDEVQTIPIRCVHLFNNALNFLVEQCNSSVVLCTATQPLLDRVDTARGAVKLSDGHSLIPDVGQLFDQLRRVEVHDACKAQGWAADEIANLILREFHDKGNCLLITNTKSAAKKLYELVVSVAGQDVVHHLSTDMCPAHRRAELDKVKTKLEAGVPVICVSTQLIEAGVDIDFWVVVRYLAGLDSIAQAAGRCNRNGKIRRGHLYIVNPRDENLGMLPDIEEGKKQARRVLADYLDDPARYDNDRLGPKALEDYYRYYFFQRRQEMSYPTSVDVDTSLLDLLALNPTAVSAYLGDNGRYPPYRFCQSFSTAARLFKAIDAPTEGIVVPYGEDGKALIAELCGASDRPFDKKLLKKAQQYTVNVLPKVLKHLSDIEAFQTVGSGLGIHCLLQEHYSEKFGLSAHIVNSPEASVWT